MRRNTEKLMIAVGGIMMTLSAALIVFGVLIVTHLIKRDLVYLTGPILFTSKRVATNPSVSCISYESWIKLASTPSRILQLLL